MNPDTPRTNAERENCVSIVLARELELVLVLARELELEAATYKNEALSLRDSHDLLYRDYQKLEAEVERLRSILKDHARQMKTDTNTNEVARLRELCERAIEILELSGTWMLSRWRRDVDKLCAEYEALAPAPEEPTHGGITMQEWYGGFAKIESTEPAPEWRELGPDEVIQEGDEHYIVNDYWQIAGNFYFGCKASQFPETRFRTRRPLPKQELPLERELKEIRNALGDDGRRTHKELIQLATKAAEWRTWKEKYIDLRNAHIAEGQDPAGTIWEHADKLQKELKETKAEVERLKKELAAWDYGTRAKREQERAEKAEAEVERLREILEPFARFAELPGAINFSGVNGALLRREDWENAIKALAPAPEEPVSKFSCEYCGDTKWVQGDPCEWCVPENPASKCDHNPNGKCADCWPIKEPVPEWRELGPDEEICEEDEGNEKGTDVWFTAGCAFWGMKPHPQGSYRFRTRRPLPKREEMPLEDDDQIERLFKDEVDLIEKWGCSKDPIRSPHAQEAFVHVIHSLRCLDNEIQQHEHMFTTWINATVDHRRDIRYLRDEIEQLKKNQK
jgi:hypothetical protein